MSLILNQFMFCCEETSRLVCWLIQADLSRLLGNQQAEVGVLPAPSKRGRANQDPTGPTVLGGDRLCSCMINPTLLVIKSIFYFDRQMDP